MATTQIAVRMEPELLEKLDWLVVRCSFENRAEAIRTVIERVAREERDREIGERMAEGYRRVPPTDDEVAWSLHNDWSESDGDDWSGWL
jgi:metal-responsive CopG/Arc/MetJ family transcriptional regulator